MNLDGIKIGFALTGSFCTFSKALASIEMLVASGAVVTPILSQAADTTDTRFMKAEGLKAALTRITEQPIIRTITEAEPIGPKKMFDVLVVLPATGNTMAKLAHGITDTTVTMAVKSHLRNNRPVVLGISTNDALGGGAKNIGLLLNTKHMYFVPFAQDDPILKPKSIVFDSRYVEAAIASALDGQQLQPLLAIR